MSQIQLVEMLLDKAVASGAHPRFIERLQKRLAEAYMKAQDRRAK